MIGRQLGRFRIVGRLGDGGMATVWRAEDVLLGGERALKTLAPGLAQSDRASRRFLHEARIGASLDHPGIVRVYDYGETDGTPWIAMALIDGEAVADVVARRRLALAEAAEVAAQVADALGYAHARRVLHRDVSARNVFLRRDGRAVLLDFGLGLAAGQTRLTSRDTLQGTATYLAPELVRGDAASPASDLYSLAVLLFEILTGTFPFVADKAEVLYYAVLNESPRSVLELRPELPTWVAELLERMLAKDPARRLQDAAAFAHELRAGSVTSAGAPPVAAPVAPPRPAPRPGDPLYLAIPAVEVSAQDGALEPEARAVSDALRDLVTCSLGADGALRVVTEAPADSSDGLLASHWGVQRALRLRVFLAAAGMHTGWSLRDTLTGVQLAGGHVDGSRRDLGSLRDALLAQVSGALGLATATAAPRAGSRPPDPAAEERYAQAVASLVRQDLESSVDGAIRLLEGLLETEGDQARLWGTLACAFLRKSRLTAERQWEARAAAAATRAFALDADSTQARTALGELQEAAGRHADALREFDRALAHADAPPAARLGRVRALAGLAREREALAELDGFIAAQPADWRGHSLRGGLHFERGRYDEALAAWTRVTELVPDNARAHLNVASALFHLDRFAESIEGYRRSIALQPTAAALSSLGTALYFDDRLEESVVALQKAVALQPGDYWLWGNLNCVLRRIPGREADADVAADRAIALLEEQLERRPGEIDGWSRLAVFLGDRARAPEARRALARALRLAPGRMRVLLDAALLHTHLHETEQALGFVRRALAAGCHPDMMRRSLELQPLHADARFQAMLSAASPDRVA